MLADLKGRVALVTGAGSAQGIGFATARLLLDQGANVAITSTTDRIHARAAELGGDRIFASVCDLRSFETAPKLIGQILGRFGNIDILVNNAGMVQSGSKELVAGLATLTGEQRESELKLHLKPCCNVTRPVVPRLIKAKYGRMVNVSSVTGPVASNPGMSA